MQEEPQRCRPDGRPKGSAAVPPPRSAAAQAEEDFFAEIRRQPLSFYSVTRPSRSGGEDHYILLDKVSHVPVDVEHPCNCAAGRSGRYCHAVLEVLQAEAPGTQAAELAAQILAERAAKSVKHGRKAQS